MARVLVVDDAEVVRLVIAMILRRAGHAVEQAENGDAAIALVAVRPPDVVVTDLWMPGSDGFGLIRALKSGFPGVAVIAMTGGSPRESEAASLTHANEAGAALVLMKPIDKDELVAAVGQALASVGHAKHPAVS
jgi:CheY-like chemotaxis protein